MVDADALSRAEEKPVDTKEKEKMKYIHHGDKVKRSKWEKHVYQEFGNRRVPEVTVKGKRK